MLHIVLTAPPPRLSYMRLTDALVFHIIIIIIITDLYSAFRSEDTEAHFLFTAT